MHLAGRPGGASDDRTSWARGSQVRGGRSPQKMYCYIRESSSWVIQWIAHDLRFHVMALWRFKGG